MLQSYKDIAAYELSTENVYLRINRLGKHRLVIHPFRTSCKRSINNELAFVITSVWQNRYRCIDELFVFLTLDCIGIVQQTWDLTSANTKILYKNVRERLMRKQDNIAREHLNLCIGTSFNEFKTNQSHSVQNITTCFYNDVIILYLYLKNKTMEYVHPLSSK